MNRIILFLSLPFVIAGCAFISPYTITFTTQNETVVDPLSDTLDLVVNGDVLAYISTYKCDDASQVDILPIVTEEMSASNVHNLSLALLNDEADGSNCKVTVTAFDQTTTEHASKDISVFVRVKPEVEEVEEVEPEGKDFEVAIETEKADEELPQGALEETVDNTVSNQESDLNNEQASDTTGETPKEKE